MDKKIIFFDIDGTILSHKTGGISDCVKKAIQATSALGHLCFIASGRPIGFLADNVKNIGFDGFVLANGADIKFHNHELEARFMDYEYVKDLCHNLKAKNIEYILQTPTYCYLPKDSHCLYDFYSHCHVNFDMFCNDYDEDEQMHRVVKMEVWTNSTEEVEYCKQAFKNFNYELHEDIHSFEVYSRVVSKATGIQDVLRILNIPLENSYCFGDGANDVEMFDTVAHPIAMGNALDMIKEKAEIICLSVDEDGVYHQLKDMFDLDI